jgi:hypothetical protein
MREKVDNLRLTIKYLVKSSSGSTIISADFSLRISRYKFKGLLSSGSTVFTCRPVADNKQYVASLHAGHKKGVISVRDRTQFPTSKRKKS